MAVAVLNDDATLYARAKALHQATAANYLRWGFSPATSATRTIGEATETLRDIYHTGVLRVWGLVMKILVGVAVPATWCSLRSAPLASH